MTPKRNHKRQPATRGVRAVQKDRRSLQQEGGGQQGRGQGTGMSRGFQWLMGLGFVAIIGLAGFLMINAHWVTTQRAELNLACELARRNGDWVRLEELARQWAIAEPEKVEPWSMAAAAARAMGDLKLCATYLSQLPETAPVDAFLELSYLQLEQLGEPFQTRDTLRKLIKSHPSNQEASRRLLFVDAMLCDRDAIRAEATRAIVQDADSRSTYAYLISASWLTFNNGYDLNQYWLGNHPNDETLQVAAACHLISHQELAAIQAVPKDPANPSNNSELNKQELLDASLERYPKNIELLSLRLSNLLQAGDPASVAKTLSAAPSETVKDHRFWRYKGWYHTAVGETDEAIIAYRKAIELEPFDWASQNELATAIRFADGVEAAAKLQSRATLGIEVATLILAAPNFEAIGDEQYAKIADYLEACGADEQAGKLRQLL